MFETAKTLPKYAILLGVILVITSFVNKHIKSAI